MVIEPARCRVSIHPVDHELSFGNQPNPIATLKAIEVSCPQLDVFALPMMKLRTLVVRLEVSFHIGDVRPIELDQAISEKVHGAHKPRHFVCQKLNEAIRRALVQALWKLDVRILMKGPANQRHVNTIKAAAIAQQNIVD